MTEQQNRVALVTGANRGLGLEACRQLARRKITTILTSRDEKKGRAAAEKLRANEGLEVRYLALDVGDTASIERCFSQVSAEFGRLDVLLNNAGIMPDDEAGDSLEAQARQALETFRINSVGPLLLSRKFIPLMRKHGYGRIVNVSSAMGQLSEMGGGYDAYRMSKAALNAVTRILASENAGSNILVNSASPGWARTDMGGSSAPSSVEEGADTLVWLATLPDGGPSGGFFEDREKMAW